MTKEGGHVQQRHVLIDEDTCEGVPQIVEAYLSQVIPLDEVGEALGDSVWS